MFKILETLYSNNRVHLGNTSIYRSQQGVISDSPSTHFERVREVSRFSFSLFLQNFVTDTGWTLDSATYGGLCYALPKKLKFNTPNTTGKSKCRKLHVGKVNTLCLELLVDGTPMEMVNVKSAVYLGMSYFQMEPIQKMLKTNF